MKKVAKILTPLFSMLFLFFITDSSYSQQPAIVFGKSIVLKDITPSASGKNTPLKWINVNTAEDTWSKKKNLLVCTGHPNGVMRSEKQYENFLLHIEWKHIEPGGNSGVFVWSNANPEEKSRLPNGVEVQMLELDWVKLNVKDGVTPPVAYVHGELFGVGGVETIPDNPRGTRSKSVENRCKGKGI